LWLIPFFILWLATLLHSRKEIRTLSKKQQISMMAYHAKHVMDDLTNNFPDTYINDCRVKMRYLSQNGVDVEAAIERLDNNIEMYNELATEFLHESDLIEDELYCLMHTDTITEFAEKSHQLRIKANDLGLIKLTDTAFFMEMEAYTNQLDILMNNWQKLSFELDDAYHILSEYINSLSSNDTITLKMWGERIQEAFSALEEYDTKTAKSILIELQNYHINSDVTEAINGILANIDE
jgi:DNA-directed RNA polymerase subunit L